MTIKEARDIIAKEEEYGSWEELVLDIVTIRKHINFFILIEEKVINLYTETHIKMALKAKSEAIIPFIQEGGYSGEEINIFTKNPL